MKKNVLLNELIAGNKCVLVPIAADSTQFADIATVAKLIPFDFTTEISSAKGTKKMAFAEKEISGADLKEFKENDVIVTLSIETIFGLIELEESAIVLCIEPTSNLSDILETVIEATLQSVCNLEDADEELGLIEKTIKVAEDGNIYVMISRISNQYAMTVLDSKIEDGKYFTLESYKEAFEQGEEEVDEEEVESRDGEDDEASNEGYEEVEVEDESEESDEEEEYEEEDDEEEEDSEEVEEEEVIETKAFNTGKYPAKKKKKH